MDQAPLLLLWSCWTAAGQHMLSFLGISIQAIYRDNSALSSSNLIPNVYTKNGIADTNATNLVSSSAEFFYMFPHMQQMLRCTMVPSFLPIRKGLA